MQIVTQSCLYHDWLFIAKILDAAKVCAWMLEIHNALIVLSTLPVLVAFGGQFVH